MTDNIHPDDSQGELLPDRNTEVTVKFVGVYDLVDDRPRMDVWGTGWCVDDAWDNACAAMAREVMDMSYSDWHAA
jgi:hypothetical protein